MKLTGLSALMHFLVDSLCICCLYLTTAESTNIVIIYVTYNVLAFLTQPLTGWWADRMQQKHWMLLGSVLLLTLAVMTASLTTVDGQKTAEIAQCVGWLTPVLLGVGNSLFHVWGGKQTAVHTGNDIRALGVFVSTGAFGLAVGAVFASWALLYVFLLGIGVLAIQTLKFPSPQGEKAFGVEFEMNGSPKPQAPKGNVISGLLILFIMLIVVGRSFAGEAFTTSITKNAALILGLGAVSMLGKMAGGWFVKGLGMWKAVTLMVVGAILCFIGKDLHITVMLIGLFLVNCTMPVTLYWANVLLKGKEGLAFGLLAAALIPGYLLATL
jgi:MFS family permease